MSSKHLPKLGSAEKVVAAAKGRSIKALRNRVLVSTLHSTGARISELLALRWGDIDWDSSPQRVWITAGKGSNDHWSFFYPECVEVMRQYIAIRPVEDYTALVPRTLKGHDPLSRHQAHTIINRLAESAGIKNFHPHSFRHNLGIRTVRSTGNIRMAQMLLGHKSIQTTAKYYSTLLPEDLAAGHQTVFSLDPTSPAQVFAGTIWNHER